MSSTPPDPLDDDFHALAGEFVLGLLDPSAAARAADLRRRDARFDAAILAWEARLMPLADDLMTVAPGPNVWQAIAAATNPPAARRNWHNLKFWRNAGLGAAAAGVAAVLILLARPPAALPLAVATLRSPSGGTFVATAQNIAGQTRLIVSPSQVSVPVGKSAELWLLLPAGPPRPLGLLARDHAVVLTMPLMPAAQLQTASLAISIEPPGGSASALPTGPVIATAAFSAL